MKICGACERELPDGSYSDEQRLLRQSSRRCEECVTTGNQLALMKKGRTRSEDDDCPICQLPLPLDRRQTMFQPCCMKEVCNGCLLAARKRGMRDCPFCRASVPKGRQTLTMIQKRIDAEDPMAICTLGSQYEHGQYGLERDVTRAVELYERAAELGVKDAHFNLACLYAKGTEVEKDTTKALMHYEVAAMCGHVPARFNLSCEENDDGNIRTPSRKCQAQTETKPRHWELIELETCKLNSVRLPDSTDHQHRRKAGLNPDQTPCRGSTFAAFNASNVLQTDGSRGNFDRAGRSSTGDASSLSTRCSPCIATARVTTRAVCNSAG